MRCANSCIRLARCGAVVRGPTSEWRLACRWSAPIRKPRRTGFFRDAWRGSGGTMSTGAYTERGRELTGSRNSACAAIPARQ